MSRLLPRLQVACLVSRYAGTFARSAGSSVLLLANGADTGAMATRSGARKAPEVQRSGYVLYVAGSTGLPKATVDPTSRKKYY